MGAYMVQSVIASAEPTVVMVVCPDLDSKGSGFLVSPDGYVITNNHVVARLTLRAGVLTTVYSTAITIVMDGMSYRATLVSDPAGDRPVVYDYAILKVEGLTNAPYLDTVDLDAVRRGDKVVCLGFPLGFDTLIATDGIVSAVLRRPSHVNALHEMQTIVTNALVHFGSSGGPMLHVATGKVIGINTLRHQVRDALRQRLHIWSSHPSAADFSLLRDLVDYSLKYTYVGINHAVSIEHVRSDAAWPR